MTANKNLKATVLCENSVSGPFGITGEHGWAVFLETDHGNLLFDTGQGQGIVSNSLILKKDLCSIECLVLSHGHYDHTGGLPKVLSLTGKIPVHGHPDIFVERRWHKDNAHRDIGIRFRRAWLESMGADFRLTRDFTEIYPGIFLTGEVPRITEFEPPDPHMQIRTADGKWEQDPLLDDLSMVVETKKGLVVILGCAHAGLVNILEHVNNMLPERPIYAVMGGTHLGFADSEQFDMTLKALGKFDVQLLGASHCTGLENSARLFAQLGSRFFFASAGSCLAV